MEPGLSGTKMTSGLVVSLIVIASYGAFFIAMEDQEAKAIMPGWREELRLTTNTTDFWGKDMAVWENYVHIVWSDFTGGNDSIYYKRSANNGLNWSDEVVLYNSFYDQTNPYIAVYENNIHVVWDDGEGLIRYINSNDNGENWNAIKSWDWTTYPPNTGPDAMIWPNIAARAGNVYLVGNSLNVGHIILIRSSDNGTTWGDWIHIGNFSFPWPSLSIDTTDSMLHVTGFYLTPMSVQWIDHYFSDDNGDTWYNNIWNPIVVVQTIEKYITHTTVSTEGNRYNLYYSLMDMDGITSLGTFVNYSYDSNPEIWYGPEQVLTNGEGHFDVDKSHIVWGEEDTNNYRQLNSNKTGQITDYASNCTNPLIRMHGNSVHILWEDDRNGTIELFYTQNKSLPNPPAPPKNHMARIPQEDPNNVIISWDSSPDDGSGEDDVAGYSIYRSNTGINGSYDFVAWIFANGSLSYSWTDVGAGDGDANDYFYIVRANDTLNNEEQNEDKVGKMVILLDEGWNLFSNPLIQNNNSRGSSLQTISGNYWALQGFHAGKSRPWLHWHKDKPQNFNDIIEVNNEEGYYIKMIVEDYIVVAGKVPTTTQISLKAGWNLVSYPCLTERTRDDALASISGLYNKVEFYNTTSDKEEGLGPDDIMHHGYGYWIHTTSDCVWEVPI